MAVRRSSVVPSGAPTGAYQLHGDGSGPGGLSVVVSIRIDLVNTAPVANADTIDASTGTVTFRPTRQRHRSRRRPAATAVVPDRPSTFTNGSQGTITAVGTDQLSIDPGSGGGIATFTYTVVDNGGLVSPPATVTVRVNRRPLANPVQATVDPDVETVVPLAGQRSRRRRTHRHAQRRAGRRRGDDHRARAHRDRTDRLLRLLVHVRLHGDRSVRARSHRRRHDRRDRHTTHDDHATTTTPPTTTLPAHRRRGQSDIAEDR